MKQRYLASAELGGFNLFSCVCDLSTEGTVQNLFYSDFENISVKVIVSTQVG